VDGTCPGQSGFAPENWITLAHFSVSSAMRFPYSLGDSASTSPTERWCGCLGQEEDAMHDQTLLTRRNTLLGATTLAPASSLGAELALAPSPAGAQTPSPAKSVSSQDVARRMIEWRAVEAAIWGIPIVSMDAMRQAFFRDAKASYSDIVFWSKPSDWKNQTTTPNASARYVYFNFNTQQGPVVLEVPAAVGAGLFGTMLDAWQVPLADDAGNSGRPAGALHPLRRGDVPICPRGRSTFADHRRIERAHVQTTIGARACFRVHRVGDVEQHRAAPRGARLHAGSARHSWSAFTIRAVSRVW
jgi:hypothetical protein